MIVAPNFSDQIDNAQRVHETGFGIRLDTYHFTDEELINALDQLLYDEQLSRKLQAAAKRIQASDRHLDLAIRIEQIVENDRNKPVYKKK